jgi:type I restriction enzyme M protein
MTFNQNARELLTTIQVWSESTKPDAGQQKQKAIARREELLAQARDAERKAREAQAAGDAIYWSLYNLDRKNPRAKDDITHLPPEELATSILQKERRIAEIMENIRRLLVKGEA